MAINAAAPNYVLRRCPLLRGAAIAMIASLAACIPSEKPTTMPIESATIGSSRALDEDGVAMLLASSPGSRFRLGQEDPNSTGNFQIERRSPAIARSDGARRYWSIAAHDLDYASGGSGKTSRLHIYASGGQQAYTWKTQKGFLSSPLDVRDQEFTAFVRVHGIIDPRRAAITLKIRGGAHSVNNPHLASCTMMTLQAPSTGAVARFGKELTHPIYDYVTLTPAFDAGLNENRWFGLKVLSYDPPGQPARVKNLLYLDVDPFDQITGKPKNGWKLFAEFTDMEGAMTGHYHTLADWGGWQTTLRSDGVSSLDFALISVREIRPAK